jgi:hypothetical protein
MRRPSIRPDLCCDPNHGATATAARWRGAASGTPAARRRRAAPATEHWQARPGRPVAQAAGRHGPPAPLALPRRRRYPGAVPARARARQPRGRRDWPGMDPLRLGAAEAAAPTGNRHGDPNRRITRHESDAQLEGAAALAVQVQAQDQAASRPGARPVGASSNSKLTGAGRAENHDDRRTGAMFSAVRPTGHC